MAKKQKNQKRLGLFYRSNGRWAGPYMGVTFTAYTWSRNPIKAEVRTLKNYTLKSRVKLLPVG